MRLPTGLAITALISSCGSTPDVPHNLSMSDTIRVVAADSLQERNPFAGMWVNAAYVADLLKTRSPRKTDVPEMSCINVPDKMGDSTVMVYGFHEGGAWLTFTKNKDRYELYDAEAASKHMEFESLGNDKVKFNKVEFVRVSVNPNPEFPILEALLFKGKYTNDQGNAIELLPGGEVKGLPGFSYYKPLIDYADQGMQVDQVLLGSDKSNTTNYGFKFRQDSLILYRLNCLEKDTANNICAVVEFGTPFLRLKKL